MWSPAVDFGKYPIRKLNSVTKNRAKRRSFLDLPMQSLLNELARLRKFDLLHRRTPFYDMTEAIVCSLYQGHSYIQGDPYTHGGSIQPCSCSVGQVF